VGFADETLTLLRQGTGIFDLVAFKEGNIQLLPIVRTMLTPEETKEER
jgi:hypothetical protein